MLRGVLCVLLVVSCTCRLLLLFFMSEDQVCTETTVVLGSTCCGICYFRHAVQSQRQRNQGERVAMPNQLMCTLFC